MKAFSDNPSLTKNNSPTLLPVQIQGQEEYLVHEILDSHLQGGKLWYLINGEGYRPEEWTWEPAYSVHTSEKVNSFQGSPDLLCPMGLPCQFSTQAQWVLEM